MTAAWKLMGMPMEKYEQLLKVAAEADVAAKLELAKMQLAGTAAPANQQSEPASEWLTTTEAAAYCRTTPSAIRTQVSRGTLAPDAGGKGTKRAKMMFRRATLDAFLRGDDGTAD